MDKKYQHIHFIGLGGIGMSAIAEILLQTGHRISGSDRAYSERLEALEKIGAKVYIGQRPENIQNDVDAVVRSTAVQDENPEIIAAREKNIPILHRSEMLAYLMQSQKAVCIAGSHGKTTTSSMAALVFEDGGLDPSIVVGGVINEIGSNAKHGRGDWLVAEADESDGSLVNLIPYISVVTNIEEDHLDHYRDIHEIRSVFETFIQKNHPDGLVVLCADCKEALQLKELSPAPVMTYGTSSEADYRIARIERINGYTEVDIFYKDALLGTLELTVPGDHNALNATAALICGLFAGVPFEVAKHALKRFGGTKRRFQLAGEVGGIKVIDDYAHHPTEIAATVKAARSTHAGRLLIVFQPHRYTRTQFLAKQFADALSGADEIFLMEIYPAGESPIEGVSSQIIADYIEEKGHEALVIQEENLAELIANSARRGDMILVMGAGNVYKEAPLIVSALHERFPSAN